MAAISQVIPNLLGGVSQQPDPLKLPGQVREAENVLLDPTFGCRKRPPTSFVAKLADDIPADAKWFSIMRDSFERYVVAIYKNTEGNTTIKVWEADTGVARTVTIDPSAVDYLQVDRVRNLNQLTINDYTLIANSEKTVTMSSNTGGERDPEALIVVNQVAYNTNYTIDFLKDSNAPTQEKVYSASKLSISPTSFEDATNGNCSLAGSQTYTETSGSKVGLGFTITTSCTPTLVTSETPGQPYPTGVSNNTNALLSSGQINYGQQAYGTYYFGNANNYAVGSYLYRNYSVTTNAGGTATVRMEFRVIGDNGASGGNRYEISSATIQNYSTVNGTRDWRTGIWLSDIRTLSSDLDRYGDGKQIYRAGSTTGVSVEITSVQQAPATPVYDYKSVYTTRVTLNNGGVNWRVGDSVTVSLNGKSYTVRVEDESFGFSYVAENTVTYTTPLDNTTGTLDVGSIVSNLTAAIDALGPYSATPVGNVIYVNRDDGKDFNIQTKGGTTNNALYGIKSSVNDVSLLPNQCVPGVVLLVRNSAESDADDYYVKFKAAAGDIPGQGAWEETVKPGITTDLNPASMPVVMVREADGDFSVRALTRTFDDTLFWAGREVGDEDSNPEPSFVGKPIKGMFFFMNRLGVLSSDSVVLSQPGDYFNFFVGSAIAVSDADPIDMTASSTRPATLKAAIGTPKGLLLFAENSQFLMATNEAAFGPATVKMTELSNYSYSSEVLPLETGVSVLFSTEADTFSKVYEMAVDSVDNRPLVSENTRIVPEYIPPNLTVSAASPNNSLVLYGNDSELLWTFKFFNTGNERSLAGWSKWIFPEAINMVAFDHDTGYIVENNNGTHILLKMEMLDDPRTSPISAFGSKFAPRLDHSLLKSQVVIGPGSSDKTKYLYFPEGAYVEETTATVILTLQGSSTLYRSPPVQYDGLAYYIEVDAAVAEEDFVLGLNYNMKVELPAFYVTQDKKPDRKNIPMVEMAYIDLYYSGRYTATLKRLGYTDQVLDIDVIDSDIYFANNAAIEEVSSREIPVFCRGDYATITINAPDPLPSSVTSYKWEGHYNNRGISII